MTLWRAILAALLGVIVGAAVSWPPDRHATPPTATDAAPACCSEVSDCCCTQARQSATTCACECRAPEPTAPQRQRLLATPVSFWLLPLAAPTPVVTHPAPAVMPPPTTPGRRHEAAPSVSRRLSMLGVRTT